MQTRKYAQGDVIFKAGTPLENISLIAEGEVSAASGAHACVLSQTDVLALADLKRGVYSYTYTARTNVSAYQYTYPGFHALDEFVRENTDAAYLMVSSICRYITSLIEHLERLKLEIETVPGLYRELYAEYSRLCKLYKSQQSPLPDVSEVGAGARIGTVPVWVQGYYMGIASLGTDVRKAFFRGNPGIVSGFLHKCAEDSAVLYDAVKTHHDRLSQISSLLLSNEGEDLFSLVSRLHIDLSENEGADFAIDTLMASLTEQLDKLSEISAVDTAFYKKCRAAYEGTLENKQQPSDAMDVLEDLLRGGFPQAEVDSIIREAAPQTPQAAPQTTKAAPQAAQKAQAAPPSAPAPKADAETQKPTPAQPPGAPPQPEQETTGQATVKQETTEQEPTVAGQETAAQETAEQAQQPSPAVAAAERSEAPYVGLNPQLVGSLEAILEYAEADKELATIFASCIKEYTALPDRNSPDDDVYDLRRDLTKSYYAVYKLVLKRSLHDEAPPSVINMFLNFGYVDGDLAGHENANFLLEIADTYKGSPEHGIFTMREWLTSIYEGKRDPSLSEFDMDYTAYIRDLKNSKQITPAEEKRMLADKEAKLHYEMDNAFPVVNRVTFGNPSKYCPVLAEHNIMRNLRDSLVKPEAIHAIIEEIRSIDFSAYYRETSYSNQKIGGISEHIHVEVLPNIILTPTVGLRGSMWQDVEGRIRTTPARMFMPIFLENDLKPLVMRLTGEFRWEICRRIQGTRWNDMTDPSLTSYFCDYLQFYMNNRSISMQTMTEIRNEVSAARNNYKNVFIQNYTTWLQHESRGMARLNSIALGILMTFCPFSADIRAKLETNMRFREALNKYGVRRQRKITHFSNLIQKIQQSAKPVPPEIKAELEFWNK